MENEKYITIKELAELKGVSPRAIRLTKSKYIIREITVKGGKSFEILLSSIEQDLQEKYYSKIVPTYEAKQLKNKTIKACKEFLNIEDLEILECQIEDKSVEMVRTPHPNPLPFATDGVDVISTPDIIYPQGAREKVIYNPAVKPLFKTSHERYEYLMKHGCTCNEDRIWLAAYKESKEFKDYETQIRIN